MEAVLEDRFEDRFEDKLEDRFEDKLEDRFEGRLEVVSSSRGGSLKARRGATRFVWTRGAIRAPGAVGSGSTTSLAFEPKMNRWLERVLTADSVDAVLASSADQLFREGGERGVDGVDVEALRVVVGTDHRLNLRVLGVLRIFQRLQ